MLFAAAACVLQVEVLIRAAPDELPAFAPELARSLLHCRLPGWADAEASSPEAKPQAQRGRALAALLVMEPMTAGDSVIAEVRGGG